MGFDDEQENAGTFDGDGYGDENQMPDGEYTIKLFSILHKEIVKKPGDVAIELKGNVVDGAHEGDPIGNSWYLSTERSNKMTLKDFNTFLQATKALSEIKVSQLRQSDICAMFAGITLKAKKETRESKGKSYVSWKYWSFVAASDSVVDHGPDIDLDEDPFKAEA